MTDRVEEGLVLFDEALAALCAGELTELATVDEIFCGLFWACELVNDVPRADQWMRAAAERMRAEQRRRPPSAAPTTAASSPRPGAGARPRPSCVEAARHFDRGMPGRRGAALIRLAEPADPAGPRRGGRRSCWTASSSTPTPCGALAALHLARGETALARDLLERATGGPDDQVPAVGESTMVGPLLALLVDVHLDEGDLEAADPGGRAAGPDRPARSAGPYLRAAAALAKGRVCLASGQGDARALPAARRWRGSRGRSCRWSSRGRVWSWPGRSRNASPEVAVAEATAALEDFERLEATRHADAAGALLRSLGAPIRTGPKGIGALTRREAEVLELIGAGLSNPEIGDRLVHHPQDRRAPRGQRAGQARPAEPGRGGRLRDPAEDQPLDRGPPRCSPARRP